MASDFVQGFQNIKLSAATAAKLPGNALAAIYGSADDAVLYWAHHEKLCLVDGHTAFMGGLDLCYGRWDTNQHSIADAHPGDLGKIVFVGQVIKPTIETSCSHFLFYTIDVVESL